MEQIYLTKKKPQMPFPSGIAKVEEKWDIFVILDRCKGCKLCVAFCPREILEENLEFLNAKGYHPPRLKPGESTEHCSGCGFCQLICPEFAIFIQETKEVTK